MTTTSASNIMMIGPSQAGKTTLLSVLRLAATRKVQNAGRVDIKPINSEAKLLFDRALDIVEHGSFVHAATAEATEYVFELACNVDRRVRREHFVDEPSVWGPFGRPTRVDRSYYEVIQERTAFTLTVLDGRGGDVFGDRDQMEDQGEYNRRRAKLVDLASKSVALVVCANASDHKNTGHFFRGLQRFLDEVHNSGARTPFERVAIALTQADRFVEQLGSGAQMKLEAHDPAQAASDALGFYARTGLFQALESEARNKVFAGWVSVYGFIPEEGSVNFDSANNRIAIFRPDDARWTDDWHPYGVVEPFLFACTGETTNLVQVTPRD